MFVDDIVIIGNIITALIRVQIIFDRRGVIESDCVSVYSLFSILLID
jgi:hypothetical protein